MPEFTYTLPAGGEARNLSDALIKTALTKLKEPTLDNTNLSASAGVKDTQLASPNNSTYRLLHGGQGVYSASASGTRYFVSSANLITGTGAAENLIMFYFDDADYTVAGKTQKLRIRAVETTVAAGPAVTLTIGMYPVTAISAGALTVGAVVSGSTVAFASTAANTLAQGNSGDFTIPADGYYVFGVANSGTTAASSGHSLYFQLQSRSV